VKGSESRLIELLKISVRKDIAINLPDTIINSIDSMEADHIVRTMVEFGSKALILSRRVGSLYRREVKEGGREKVEELQGKVDKFEEERVVWKKEKEGWEEERMRLAMWRVRCLDSEEKLNKRIRELEEDYDDLKDKYDGVVGELCDLKNCIIQEHINDFEKGLRQASFFHQEVDITDSKFNVNKDVIDGKLVKEDGSSPDGELKRFNQRVEGVRPKPLTCSKGGELKTINIKLRVFDLGRLLVERVRNLNDYESEIEKRCIVENPSFYSLNLGCLVKTSLAKTLLREKRPGEEKEYTQGYKYSV